MSPMENHTNQPPTEKMRRSDKAITDETEMEAVIRRAEICRLGLITNNHPYIIPMAFTYEPGFFYMHSSKKGLKITAMEENPNCCVEIDMDVETRPHEVACKWGMAYTSIVAFGRTELIQDPAEKTRILDLIMAKYDPESHPEYLEKMIKNIAVIKVAITSMTGKKS